MRAITGTGRRRNTSQLRCTSVMKARADAGSRSAISLMSAPPMKARSPAPRSTTARRVPSMPRASTAATRSDITAVFNVFSFAGLSIVTTATPRASRCIFTQAKLSSADCLAHRAIPYSAASHNEGEMAIALRQPHRSWYRHFWYAERSPGDTLTDRTLLFAIVALSLIVGGMLLVRHHAEPRGTGQFAVAEPAR